jgi:choice-of-anchor B domain-containing protein
MYRSISGLFLAGAFWCAVSHGQYSSLNVQLLGQRPLNQIGGGGGNDIWGWTDSLTGREYALVGRTNGTAFVDITNATNPVYLGNLPTHTSTSTWRDLKVYRDHVYVVSDNNGPHGLQIFDLRNLRGVTTPQTFAESGYFNEGGLFRNAHNIAINEDTGFAYIVGSNRAVGGLYMLNLANPLSPVVAGQFGADGYTHDTQVVVYRGPDTSFVGREIAFNSNEDTLTIVDVTNKSTPAMLSRTGYPQAGYTHQGWLTEDQRYFFFDDELDEIQQDGFTRTHAWDVSDLNAPQYLGFHTSTVQSIDHNLYIKGNRIYEANYTSGLRVFDIVDPATATLNPFGFIDTLPQADGVGFNGAWSVYPFFDSGLVIVNDIANGLFVVRLQVATGDFNADGRLDCADVNVLSDAIARGRVNSSFDLNGDSQVNGGDLSVWLAQAGSANLPNGAPFLPADANLDGVVDGQDFTTWNAHKFTENHAFCSGNFNGDRFVDGQDFLIWNDLKFQSSTAVQAVPEPAPWQLMLCVATWLARRCQWLRRVE